MMLRRKVLKGAGNLIQNVYLKPPAELKLDGDKLLQLKNPSMVLLKVETFGADQLNSILFHSLK